MIGFPRTDVDGLSVSRLVIGTNWFLGFSHCTAAKDAYIKEHIQRRKVLADILEVFFRDARFETAHDYFGTLSCELGDQPAVTLSNDEVLARFMALEGLRPRDEDLRSLGGLCDRRFLECAAAGRPATPDFEQALAAHRVVEACYRSAAEGREIVVNA